MRQHLQSLATASITIISVIGVLAWTEQQERRSAEELFNTKTSPIPASKQPRDSRDADLDRRLARIESQLARLSAAESVQAPTHTANEGTLAIEERTNPAEPTIDTRVQFRAVEETLNVEAVDAAWASGAQQDIQHAFDQGALRNYQLIATECRTTLCRLEVGVSEAGIGPEVFSDIQQNVPWDGAGYMTMQDNPKRAIVFLARDGAG